MRCFGAPNDRELTRLANADQFAEFEKILRTIFDSIPCSSLLSSLNRFLSGFDFQLLRNNESLGNWLVFEDRRLLVDRHFRPDRKSGDRGESFA